MPETPIKEHGDANPGEHEVGCPSYASDRPYGDSVAETERVDCPTES